MIMAGNVNNLGGISVVLVIEMMIFALAILILIIMGIKYLKEKMIYYRLKNLELSKTLGNDELRHKIDASNNRKYWKNKLRETHPSDYDKYKNR